MRIPAVARPTLLACGAVLLTLALPAAAGPWTAGRAGDERAARLRSGGGNAATERAVEAGLDWLARHRGDEGLWDADGFMRAGDGCDCDGPGAGWHGEPVPCAFDREVSALALLAFLGAGHVPGDEGHGPLVRDGLAALEGGLGQGTLWATAYATQAFAEAWDLTGDERWREAAERGVGMMLAARQPGAAWRYFAGSRMASGVPTTTACVVALRTAAACGIEVDVGWHDEVLAWLDGLVDRDTGRVDYIVDAAALGYTPTTTNAASALWIRAMLGVRDDDPRQVLQRKALAARPPKWSIRFKRMKVGGVERDVQIGYLQHYYWWHATDALTVLDSGDRGAWFRKLKQALLPHQRGDGHATGSWDPVGTYGRVGGRVFSTALCTLMLEAPYRLPRGWPPKR